ncbi:MAG: hypothetical protein ABTQ25_06345 [Nitrosomonas ureae]
MQAIELKANITLDGHIVLPEALQSFYGTRARLIILLEEPKKKEQSKLLALRGTMKDSPDFDKAMRVMEEAWQQ